MESVFFAGFCAVFFSDGGFDRYARIGAGGDRGVSIIALILAARQDQTLGIAMGMDRFAGNETGITLLEYHQRGGRTGLVGFARGQGRPQHQGVAKRAITLR